MNLRTVFFACVFYFVLNTIQCDFDYGGLNSECTTVHDCKKFGYMCSRNRTCQCVYGYFSNPSRTRCLASVGQKCEYDEDCLEGGFCKLQKQCECKEHLAPQNDGHVCATSSFKLVARSSIVRLIVIMLLFHHLI